MNEQQLRARIAELRAEHAPEFCIRALQFALEGMQPPRLPSPPEPDLLEMYAGRDIFWIA